MNANRKRKKAKKEDARFLEWRKDRDEAVASLDLQKFKAFCLKWQGRGAYKLKTLPADNILEITMYKMACEITSIPEDIALKAAEWLLVRGYIPGIQWGTAKTEREGDNNDSENSTDSERREGSEAVAESDC